MTSTKPRHAGLNRAGRARTGPTLLLPVLALLLGAVGPFAVAPAQAHPAHPVTDLAAAPGDGKLTVTWTNPPGAGAGVTDVSVQWKAQGTSGWQSPGRLLAGSANSYEITGLMNGTTYDVRVSLGWRTISVYSDWADTTGTPQGPSTGDGGGPDDDDDGSDDDDSDDDGDGSDDGGGGPDDDDDDADGESSSCTLVAPYWSGPSGGFTAMSAPGRTSVSVTCGRSTTEYSAENGLVTRLVRGSCPGGLRLEGAAPGGWYWQHDERNAAVAPFVCSETLEGPRAVAPGGVMAEATDDATYFRHDTSRLVGIVPHLAGNECSEYVTPYWQGDGGVVVRPAEGRSTARVRVQCGETWSTLTASAGTDGVAAELVRKDYCTDEEGEPRQGRLTVTGAAPGGWYWISGERNAAVAPLMCADLLGGPAAVDPGGVFSRSTEDGTYFKHDADRLIGVVPHVATERDE